MDDFSRKIAFHELIRGSLLLKIDFARQIKPVGFAGISPEN